MEKRLKPSGAWKPAIFIFVTIGIVAMINSYKLVYDIAFDLGKNSSSIDTSIVNSVIKVTYEPQELKMIDLVNGERQKIGLNKLTENGLLDVSARNKACDMGNKNYFEHTSPEGNEPWVFIKKTGYYYSFAGENISRGNDIEKAMIDFMNSKEHKDNILNPNYKEIGIGVCGEYLVQHFASR